MHLRFAFLPRISYTEEVNYIGFYFIVFGFKVLNFIFILFFCHFHYSNKMICCSLESLIISLKNCSKMKWAKSHIIIQNTTDTSPASTQNLAANQVMYLSFLKQERLSAVQTLAFTFSNSINFKTNFYVPFTNVSLSVLQPYNYLEKYILELMKCGLHLINTVSFCLGGLRDKFGKIFHKSL